MVEASRHWRRWVGLTLLIGLVGFEGTSAAAPSDAERVQRVAEQLRCVVCQNQSIAESQAPLAVALREQVREQLASGASEAQVMDFMVQRYGDFVLYKPPLKPVTALLWFGPALMGAFGLGLLWRRVRQQSGRGDDDDKHAVALDGPVKVNP